MHSHYGFQEQNFVEAPLIIYPKGYDASNDLVIMFQDFSLKKSEDIKHDNNSHHDMHGMDIAMNKDMKLDFNDVSYDAFLTHYKAVDNPEIKKVVAG